MEETDDRLLHRIESGDRDVAWELWLRYRGYVEQVCIRQMHGRNADAEDALSEIALKVFEKLSTHASQIVNFKAWLVRLATNHCIDIHRHRAQCETRNIDLAEYESQESARLPAPSMASFPDQATQIVPEVLLREMTPASRQVFVSRFVHEKSYSEIAVQLGISTACARKRIQRAVAILRKNLASAGDVSALGGL